MRKLYFSLGVLLSFYRVYAQEKYPSGVPTPLYWIKTEKEKGKTQVKEKIKGQTHFIFKGVLSYKPTETIRHTLTINSKKTKI